MSKTANDILEASCVLIAVLTEEIGNGGVAYCLGEELKHTVGV